MLWALDDAYRRLRRAISHCDHHDDGTIGGQFVAFVAMTQSDEVQEALEVALSQTRVLPRTQIYELLHSYADSWPRRRDLVAEIQNSYHPDFPADIVTDAMTVANSIDDLDKRRMPYRRWSGAAPVLAVRQYEEVSREIDRLFDYSLGVDHPSKREGLRISGALTNVHQAIRKTSGSDGRGIPFLTRPGRRTFPFKNTTLP